MKISSGIRFVFAFLIAVLVFGAFATPNAQAAAPKAQAAEESNSIVDVVLAANAETGEFSILIGHR